MTTPKYLQTAYDEHVKFVLRMVPMYPVYKPTPLTRKQKIEREIKYRKRLLGKLLYKISNRLGYYDDDY